MIHFSAMSDAQYTTYLAYFIPEYAEDIASNYPRSIDEALAQAKAEMARHLPDDQKTEGQILRNILTRDGQELIGYVWYCPNETARSVFIYDFYILPDHRAKGHGKAALQALEIMLAAEGYREIRLRVAADNPRAQHVYQTGGFRITGHNMAKSIGPQRDDA
jgi:ribosomal protein S18 acetylase RimI-like enzyme